MDWKTSVSAFAIGAVSLAAAAQPLGPEQKRFHAIYKELVETNTTHSAGDTTLAAQRMARHLREAGFAEADVQILEPFPRKGNLVARFRGDGSKKPLLLLAHLDVVEALRADWKTDPFVLQESDGFSPRAARSTTRRWPRPSCPSCRSSSARASGRSATSSSR